MYSSLVQVNGRSTKTINVPLYVKLSVLPPMFIIIVKEYSRDK